MDNAKNEYVVSRCVELLEEDEDFRAASQEIVLLEDKFAGTISPELNEILTKIEDIKEKQAISIYAKIYKAGFNDRIVVF